VSELDAFDDPNQILSPISLLSGKMKKVPGSDMDSTSLCAGARYRHASTTPEFQQALVAQKPERPENRVGVHFENCRKVSCGGQPFARLGFTVSDGAPDLCGHLLVQGESLVLST
jgi:hypothetical protein